MTEQSRVNVQEIYSDIADSYDEWREENPRGRLVSDHDIHMFNSIFPKELGDGEVLEIGAGTGRFTLPVLERGVAFTATDVNESMLESLKVKVEECGFADKCKVQTADIFNLDFDDSSFGFIFTLHVIPRFQSLSDQVAAIKEIARVLKPGGRLLFNYSNRTSLYGLLRKKHVAKHSEIKAALKDANMRIVTMRGKWLMSRLLVNRLPLFLGKLVGLTDRAMSRFLPGFAWDVYIIAEKQ
ncbi:MAG: class I SAM-dependent methyltransferase [Phycisphaerales bacterium]|nr:class I SAM-dependent methyltransferase [Phycisphaerales bacterium]MDP7189981.1 class I SAM-dependent methyltransferase [Phycisphaerales bacterium]MDP7519858.1 class I SAM-dependent methyltransferase [Phycisphaerales bacterium]HJN80381.1 class I SAM-dependent methyltransferase [Phycisphaerales bacterium]